MVGENIQQVRDSVEQESSTSIRHRAQELGLSRTVLHNVLTKDLNLSPYKIQMAQQLQENDR